MCEVLRIDITKGFPEQIAIIQVAPRGGPVGDGKGVYLDSKR